MKKCLSLIIFALLGLGIMPAMAGDLRIGVLDMQQIMQKATQVQNINRQLENQYKPRQAKIIAAQKALRSEVDKFRQNSTTMSGKDRDQAQKRIAQDNDSLNKMVASFQQDLSNAQNQGRKQLFTALNGAIRQVAAQGKFNVILLRGNLLYSDDNLNVTDAVLKILNKG